MAHGHDHRLTGTIDKVQRKRAGTADGLISPAKEPAVALPEGKAGGARSARAPGPAESTQTPTAAIQAGLVSTAEPGHWRADATQSTE